MKVQIAIEDRRQSREAEKLGLEVEPSIEYTSFWFRDELIESFWVDAKDNEIVFSIGGDDYRTPYTPELFKYFKEILA